jgi:hypothetical protein
VLAFLGALAESAVERWRSKIMIVGEATVGRPSSLPANRALRVSCGEVSVARDWRIRLAAVQSGKVSLQPPCPEGRGSSRCSTLGLPIEERVPALRHRYEHALLPRRTPIADSVRVNSCAAGLFAPRRTSNSGP